MELTNSLLIEILIIASHGNNLWGDGSGDLVKVGISLALPKIISHFPRWIHYDVLFFF